MKHIAIIDSQCGADSFCKMLLGSFTFSAVNDEDGFSEAIRKKRPDAVIVNADHADDKLSEIISYIRNDAFLKNVPVMLLTSDNNQENQQKLSGLYVDDVLFLPLCRELVVRRINTLIAASESAVRDESSVSAFDFDEFIDTVTEKNLHRGAFCVKQSEFANIYKFVRRGLDRSGKSVQILLFTLNCHEDSDCSECEAKVMEVLSDAVQLCLRRGDLSSVCSKNQVVILLVGADDNGGHLVANRILSSFYSECDDEAYELNYDIREINVNEVKT